MISIIIMCKGGSVFRMMSWEGGFPMSSHNNGRLFVTECPDSPAPSPVGPRKQDSINSVSSTTTNGVLNVRTTSLEIIYVKLAT